MGESATQTRPRGRRGTARQTGLTHRFTHSHTIILRLKIVPVAAAATIYKAHALPLGEVEVPAGHHGPARPRQRLLGADSCVEMVRRSAGRGSGFRASQSYRPARGEGLSDTGPQQRPRQGGTWAPGPMPAPSCQPSLSARSSSFTKQGSALGPVAESGAFCPVWNLQRERADVEEFPSTQLGSLTFLVCVVGMAACLGRLWGAQGRRRQHRCRGNFSGGHRCKHYSGPLKGPVYILFCSPKLITNF